MYGVPGILRRKALSGRSFLGRYYRAKFAESGISPHGSVDDCVSPAAIALGNLVSALVFVLNPIFVPSTMCVELGVAVRANKTKVPGTVLSGVAVHVVKDHPD